MIFSYNNVCWHILMNLMRHVHMTQPCWLLNRCSKFLKGWPGFVFKAPWIPLIKAAFTKHYEWCIAHPSRLENRWLDQVPPLCASALVGLNPLQHKTRVVGVVSFQNRGTYVVTFPSLNGFYLDVTIYKD